MPAIEIVPEAQHVEKQQVNKSIRVLQALKVISYPTENTKDIRLQLSESKLKEQPMPLPAETFTQALEASHEQSLFAAKTNIVLATNEKSPLNN